MQPARSSGVIRVVIADDSALMRKALKEILESVIDIRVVAMARDGQEVVDAVRRYDPDVVTLDINMPVVDGITALQMIMHEKPRPVVMCSSLTQEGALTTYECMELGAVDVIGKPSGTISLDLDCQTKEIIAKIRAASKAQVGRLGRKPARTLPPPAPPPSVPAEGIPASRLVAVGVSTGGPKTLMEVLPLLPANFPAAVVVVQHMPPSFTASLAQSLNRACQMPVREADAGEVLQNGRIYVARGGQHLVFTRRKLGRGFMARYQSNPADHLHIPSVDVMMMSAAETFGAATVGVLLTGMGCDGADGMVKIRRAGGETIAEAESTCVVFGMPAEAIARGGATRVLPCDRIADDLRIYPDVGPRPEFPKRRMLVQLDPIDFRPLRDLVYARTGLMFEDRKLSFVESRLTRRALAVGVGTAADYHRYLLRQDHHGIEFQAFVEELTTNETYFFRDYPQLETLANEVLPRIANDKRARSQRTLNVWSAPCSTGDEAYTLAIMLLACLDDFSMWKVRILGTDLDTKVLEFARKACYSQRAIRDVPGPYLDKYFTRSGDDYRVCDRIRQMVEFKKVNLVDAPSMRQQTGFDIILCRNVLIYFDDASRTKVLGHLYDALVPGGFVFLGHAESIVRMSDAFEPVTFGKTVVYRKPLGIGAKPTIVTVGSQSRAPAQKAKL